MCLITPHNESMISLTHPAVVNSSSSVHLVYYFYTSLTYGTYHFYLSFFIILKYYSGTPTTLFVHTMTHICNLVCPEPTPNPFMFTATTMTALHNGKLLSVFKSNLRYVINTHSSSSLSYGSEFQPISQLQGLLDDHPSSPKLHNTILHSSNHNLLHE